MKISEVKYTTPPVPRQARLDTVNYCNARCRWCHILDLKREKVRMPMTFLEQIVDEIATWPQPPVELCPVNYGEFFLRQDWFDILKLVEAKLPQTRIVVPTNGALLDWEGLRKLLSIKTLHLVNFSVNARFDESYEEIMGLPAKNMAHIRNLAARIRQERPQVIVWVSMVFNGLWMTDCERDLFIDYWRDIAIPQVNSGAFCNGREKPWRVVKEPCRSIFSDLVVGYDGRIGSCCYLPNFDIDLGKYPEDGKLLELWQSEKFRRLRQIHGNGRRGDLEPCRDCTYA